MQKPLIGLTPAHDTKNDDLNMRPTYMRAVSHAGGIPVMLPLEASTQDLEQLAKTLDGFLFTGGPDIHPFYFGEETLSACGNVSPARDKMELELLSLVMKTGKPILGICRGVQLINVGLGGNIYQDLPSQFKEAFPIAHTQPFYYTSPAHRVTVVDNTRLMEIVGEKEIPVNSMHHQAIRKVAPALTVSAYAANSLVEAVEMPDYPFLLGVQWHPEYLWETIEAHSNLFHAFVDACK